jgi:hypothetical protein
VVPQYKGCWLVAGLQRALLELGSQTQAPRIAERLRVGCGACKLGVCEGWYQPRYGEQRGKQPPPAWPGIAQWN